MCVLFEFVMPEERSRAAAIDIRIFRIAMSIPAGDDRSSGEGRTCMPKYALLLGGADLDKRSGNAALMPKLFERFSSWLGELRASGHYLDSHKLHDQTGARLTVRGGQVVES